MAKFLAKIGFFKQVETRSGVWTEEIVERSYYGNIVKQMIRHKEGEGLLDDLTTDNRLSIVADPYAQQKFHAMRYIEWMGARWRITSVEVQYPRLILTVGGVYNGPTAPTP